MTTFAHRSSGSHRELECDGLNAEVYGDSRKNEKSGTFIAIGYPFIVAGKFAFGRM